MKKILLLAVFAMACVLSSRANTFTFYNLSGCTFTYYIVGNNPGSTTQVASAPVNVPPGTMVFPTPSSIPGFATAPATFDFHFVRGWVNTSPTYSANVGDNTMPSFTSPVSIPAFPCNNNQGSTISWNASNGNIVVLIF